MITNTLEKRYADSVSLEHRKKFAQFFTPVQIADVMAEWLLGSPDLQTVLDPAFGMGIFSRVLLSKKKDLRIKGFEIDERIYGEFLSSPDNCQEINLILQDYMFNDWEHKYDGIICNPPYFKFHDYDNKSVLKEISKRLNCRLNGFTNLYTLFLLKSIYQLAPGGRCAYIIPSEFLNSDYGKLVKQHLIKTGTLRHIFVIDFKENIFDDALTTACIVLCANDEHKGIVQFGNISSLDSLKEVAERIHNYPTLWDNPQTYSLSELDPEIKWRNYYQPQKRLRFKHLVPFSQYARVMRGIATGDNDYFTFTEEKAAQWGIDKRYLIPCVCHSIDIKGNIFDSEQFEELSKRQKRMYILNAVGATDEHVLRYVRKGEEEGVNKKYLTSQRSPWYSVERREVAPIWVSVFNRSGLRFVRNESNARNLTTFHCIYPKTSQLWHISDDLLFAYLLTDTARQIFCDNAREYGNGLQKFEPNDLNKGMMLDLCQLPQESQQKIVQIYQSNKDKAPEYYISQIDEILFTYFVHIYEADNSLG